jgi:hypothetical protein
MLALQGYWGQPGTLRRAVEGLFWWSAGRASVPWRLSVSHYASVAVVLQQGGAEVDRPRAHRDLTEPAECLAGGLPEQGANLYVCVFGCAVTCISVGWWLWPIEQVTLGPFIPLMSVCLCF